MNLHNFQCKCTHLFLFYSLFSKKNINFARKFDLRHCQDTMLVEKIDALRKEVEALTASNAEEIEALRLKYLSKKGERSEEGAWYED